ncbi:response regulator [Cryptosporangium aurantiacum]|uniref:Two-component system, unclassified family, response regulator n=1 Tax=Cryptosporangium aurantiacum TaxID=134849 RepID=A0A1M7REL7_9ACTN|nr:response regulator [Cryptosporangium aurantiacum]SHN44622.1 two-component system, unclassified family, response regulator [Cryptosporangium aurantiacum]
MSTSPLEVLVVDDDAGDVLMIEEALSANEVPSHLHVVSDGVEALSFLRREDPHADAPRPQLILLDLNMPRMDGREVLAAVKSDDELRSIPVVVLTTSALDEDVLRSYELRANAFVTKPVDLDQFTSIVQQIESFYGRTVRLPR